MGSKHWKPHWWWRRGRKAGGGLMGGGELSRGAKKTELPFWGEKPEKTWCLLVLEGVKTQCVHCALCSGERRQDIEQYCTLMLHLKQEITMNWTLGEWLKAYPVAIWRKRWISRREVSYEVKELNSVWSLLPPPPFRPLSSFGHALLHSDTSPVLGTPVPVEKGCLAMESSVPYRQDLLPSLPAPPNCNS